MLFACLQCRFVPSDDRRLSYYSSGGNRRPSTLPDKPRRCDDKFRALPAPSRARGPMRVAGPMPSECCPPRLRRRPDLRGPLEASVASGNTARSTPFRACHMCRAKNCGRTRRVAPHSRSATKLQHFHHRRQRWLPQRVPLRPSMHVHLRMTAGPARFGAVGVDVRKASLILPRGRGRLPRSASSPTSGLLTRIQARFPRRRRESDGRLIAVGSGGSHFQRAPPPPALATFRLRPVPHSAR